MKILWGVPELNTGGVENFVVNIVPKLKKCGLDITVISSGGKLVKQLYENNIEHITFDLKSKNLFNLLTVFKLKNFFKTNKFDVIHAHSRVPAWLFYLTCEHKRKLVFSPHGRYRIHFGSRIVEKYPLLIFGAKTLGDYFKDSFNLTGKTELAFYGIDVNKFDMQFNIKKDPFVFGAVGRLSKVKGFGVLIKAFYKAFGDSKKVKLIIAGSGPEYDNLNKLIGDLRVNIELMGHIDDMKKFYNMINVIVISSWREGLPLTLLEAMASKRCAIASTVGDIPLIVEHEKSGFLFPPGNIEMLSNYMKYIYENSNKLLEFSHNSYIKVKIDYNIDRQVNDIIEIYKKYF